MTGFVKQGGIWNQIIQPKLKTGGVWNDAQKAWVKQGGVWNEWFSAAPAAPPAQVTDLQIVAYRRPTGTTVEVDLTWTPPVGAEDYILDVWNSAAQYPNYVWKGTPVNGDGTGGSQSYVPQQTLTITGAGTYTWTATVGSGSVPYIAFRITPRNATGSATFPSNCPWITGKNVPTEVPVPTPLLTSPVTWTGNATLANANFTWSPPTTNLGSWFNSAPIMTQYGANFFVGAFGGFVPSAPSMPTTVQNVSFPYGVLTAAIILQDSSSQPLCGNIHMVPNVGTTRVPFTRAGYDPTPYTLVAATNTYEGGAFPDTGYGEANQGTSPVQIGSLTPTATPDGTLVYVMRSGATTCTLGLRYSRTVDASSFYCVGYGDANELARYVYPAQGSFVADDGNGVCRWTWALPSRGGVWALVAGQTYTFYFT
jgi:hypothetical protein